MPAKFSIRSRLTLHFGVLFGAIVVSLAIAVYAVVRYDAYAKIDSQLQTAVDATAMSAGHELAEHVDRAGGEADLQTVLSESPDAALPGTQILVIQQGRLVAYRAAGVGEADLRSLPLSQATPFNLQGMRVVSREFTTPQFPSPYLIYSARSLAPVVARLRTLSLALFLFVPLGLALASLAGYFLARRALEPLSEFAATLDSIQSSNLNERVAVSGREDEIERLALPFNALLERLERAFALQRSFMADASHELRTPVSIALSAVQVTARAPRRNADEIDHVLALVERQMLRLKHVLADMLFLSQADASPLCLDSKEIFFDDAITDACDAVRVLARAKDQSLIREPLPEAHCLGDYELLKQAVVILLDNAVKFTPAGGKIEVSLRRQGNFWACQVADSGCGIPLDAQSAIFQRFYRAETPGIKVAGAGLGLAIAKSIVERHSGQIGLLSSLPGRTIFEITLPALPTTQAAGDTQAKSLAVKI